MLKRFELVLAFGKRLSLVNESSGFGLNPRGGRNFVPVENIEISSHEIDESPAATEQFCTYIASIAKSIVACVWRASFSHANLV